MDTKQTASFVGITVSLVFSSTAPGEEPITGEALTRASAAALEYTGGGRVTETEVGDEEGYYEVEVTLASGEQIDVHLDAEFRVINAESDSEPDDEADEIDDEASDDD
jgi:hypothetical protein